MSVYALQNVCVVGLGYVGLPTAAIIASAGHRVTGVDVSKRTVETLSQGRSTIEEPGVKELVEHTLASGALTVSSKPVSADIFLICVPTPVTDDKRPDLKMVESAVQSIVGYVRPGNLVILESTSPIGTTRQLVGSVLTDGRLDLSSLDVCYCPERVFPGSSLQEIIKNSRVVGGLTAHAARRAGDFYRTFCQGQVMETSAEVAEFSKLAENTFRDVNIALANSFAHIAERAGIDFSEVIEVANQHPRVNIHRPGAGVGGHCIPVDPWFLISDFPDETRLLHAARKINDGQPIRLLDRAEAAGLRPGSQIAVLGLAYRGDIGDPRESPSEHLISEARRRGYRVKAQDPIVEKRHVDLTQCEFVSEVDEALKDVQAAFLMTDHSAYRDVGERLLAGSVDIVVDGRRMLDGAAIENASVTVLRVGAPDLPALVGVRSRALG